MSFCIDNMVIYLEKKEDDTSKLSFTKLRKKQSISKNRKLAN